MNQRIRELAEQARKHFPKTDTSGEFWVFDEQKFAELIVKECIEVVEDSQGYNQYFPHVTENIKQHFGVE